MTSLDLNIGTAEIVFVLLVAMIPLGIWKLTEIVCWLIPHVTTHLR